MGATADSLEVGGSIAALLYDQNNDNVLDSHELESAIAQGADLSLLSSISPENSYVLYGQLPETIQTGLRNNSSIQLQTRFFKSSITETKKCFVVTDDLSSVSARYFAGDTIIPNILNSAGLINFIPDPDGEHMAHNAESPIIGLQSETFHSYETFAMDNPALLRFGNALYYDNAMLPNFMGDQALDGYARFKMIPVELQEQADQVAKFLYLEYCSQHGLDPQTAVSWSEWKNTGGIIISDRDRDYWSALALVGAEGISETHNDREYYNSPYLVALHELSHIERTEIGHRHKKRTLLDSSIDEIGTVIEEIILKDTIYKYIEGIPLDQEVDYPEALATSDGAGLNLGLVANTFRDLQLRYGSIEAALMSEESMAFVTSYYLNEVTADEQDHWEHTVSVNDSSFSSNSVTIPRGNSQAPITYKGAANR